MTQYHDPEIYTVILRRQVFWCPKCNRISKRHSGNFLETWNSCGELCYACNNVMVRLNLNESQIILLSKLLHENNIDKLSKEELVEILL